MAIGELDVLTDGLQTLTDFVWRHDSSVFYTPDTPPQKRKGTHCHRGMHRPESNPEHIDGNDVFYH